MPNMSYCRFENTMGDLYDCLRNIRYEAENNTDENYRQEMITLFKEIAEDYEGDVIGYAMNNLFRKNEI